MKNVYFLYVFLISIIQHFCTNWI